MENANEQQEMIPESRAARWAWRVSLIPLLGVPLFILLAFIALYRIGSKGRTGFWLLRRGVFAVFLLSIIPYFGLYFAGYSGYYPIIHKLYLFLPVHGEYRDFHYNGKIKSHFHVRYGTIDGIYTRWYDNGKICQEGKRFNGRREGKEITYWENGKKWSEYEFKNNELDGPFINWDEEGNLQDFGKYEDGVLIPDPIMPPNQPPVPPVTKPNAENK